MSERQELVQAIVNVEAQRSLLGNAVVETALWALRSKLASLPATAVLPALPEQQLTVLVADLSDFTALAARLDVEHVRDLVNEIWQELDGVIGAWGGKVDKHVGDAVIAHFGLPYPRSDDPERAIQAALEMQMALAWLNRHGARPRPGPNATLGMRIGIHTGPVFLGKLGSDGGVTAVGDTVMIAGHLEQAAPVDGVLISEEVYRLVHGRFDVRPVSPVAIPEKGAVMPALVVEGMGPRPFREPQHRLSALEPRTVGRVAELEQLQSALQLVADSGTSQVVVVSGADGCGKSRLLDEFERWLVYFPAKLQVLRGRAYQAQGVHPYALLRDLFTAYLDIAIRYSTAVARENLVRALVARLTPVGVAPETARTEAVALGHLLGFDLRSELDLPPDAPVTEAVREQAFAALTHLMAAITAEETVAVLFLEDIGCADEQTLDLLERLVAVGQAHPVLFVCTARPGLWEKRPHWLQWTADPFEPYERLDLGPLSAIDGRHLVNDLLQKAPRVPLRLVDLIVAIAEGNPLGIEETVKLLIDYGVIQPGEEHWQVHMAQLDALRLPADVRGVMRLRLAQLPMAERTVLQRAAVFGRVFADKAVAQMGQGVEPVVTADLFAEALVALEHKDFIYRSPTLHFSGAQEYLFRYESWRWVAYDSLETAVRQAYHRQAAYWLIAHCGGPYQGACAPLIAAHFLHAGDEQQAAVWRDRAPR